MTAPAGVWTAYYDAQAGRSPRAPLLAALARFEPAPAGRVRGAVDLGCGTGVETLHLLGEGWRVMAVDAERDAIERLDAAMPQRHRAMVQLVTARFEDVTLPPCELVHASYSLPFCGREAFPGVWSGVVNALIPGGRFVGEFFGERDTWADELTVHSGAGVADLLGGFDVEELTEEENDGESCSGPKHWHVFHVTARRRDP